MMSNEMTKLTYISLRQRGYNHEEAIDMIRAETEIDTKCDENPTPSDWFDDLVWDVETPGYRKIYE